MIGKRLICAATSFVLLIAPASAQWVVSDPGSYAYYVEQIKQQVEMVEKAAQQVETMGGVLTEAQKIQSAMTGNYNRAVGLVDRIKGVADAIGRDTGGGIFDEAKKWGNVGRKIGAAGTAGGRVLKDVGEFSGDDRYSDTKGILDEVFADPREIADANDRYRAMDRKYQMQQGALKDVIARAEGTLGGIKDRVKVVEELAGMIDKTANQKDAQDLTNRILVEVLATLIDMLQVAALSNQADALNQYQGVSDSAMEQRKAVLDSTNAEARSLKEILGTSVPDPSWKGKL